MHASPEVEAAPLGILIRNTHFRLGLHLPASNRKFFQRAGHQHFWSGRIRINGGHPFYRDQFRERYTRIFRLNYASVQWE